jgi:glycosyltransferase involved in cell wall biosynthesis/predicted metal-dependent phosphoesterase TrpH
MPTPNEQTGRVDFHLHSLASNKTTYYAANAFSIPESYSDPVALYALLKSRGMSLVTLSDHNTIDGAKLLRDKGFEDVFYSVEATATFPEDGCHIHVLVTNISESQFREVDRLRENVYDMVAYLDREIARELQGPVNNRLAYMMAHPLMSTENRARGREGALTLGHIERALLLFDGFEIQNGSRAPALNELTGAMIASLDARRIEELANRHGIAPKGETPWKKFVTGGSDDHSGINPGRTWTSFSYTGGRPTANDAIAALRNRTSRPGGAHGGPIALAHSILKLLYLRSKQGAPPVPGSAVPVKTTSKTQKAPSIGLPVAFASLLSFVFRDEELTLRQRLTLKVQMMTEGMKRNRHARLGQSFEALVTQEIYGLLAEPGFQKSLENAELTTDERIFLVVSSLINRVFARYVDNVRRAGASNLVDVIREVVALCASNLFVSLPYFAAFLAQSSDAHVSGEVREAFGLGHRRRLALFTDTYAEINGVSATIKRMIAEAIRRDVDFTVVTCLSEGDRRVAMADADTRRFVESGRLKIFSCISEIDCPEYDGLKIRIPPLLDVLRFLQEGSYTKVHVSTPGPVGLAGLAAAKVLQVETAATYHTSFPEYVENYTQDIALEEFAWKYMLVFYHMVDEVLVPSGFIAKLLHKRGLRNRKLLILDRWVDVDRFRPECRAAGNFEYLGLKDDPKIVRFVYVGRLGVEKNLALLVESFRMLCQIRSNVQFVVIGDGPYRQEMERGLAGLPVAFTGYLKGDELPRAIASCDVKLFPSTTDTWGNAPLEAQACGLPVIVSEIGGPSELMEPEVTGIRVGGRDAAELTAAMDRMMDADRRRSMGLAARAFSEANRVDEPFTAVFDSDAYRRKVAEAKAAAGEAPRVPISTQVFDLATSFEQAFETVGVVRRA